MTAFSNIVKLYIYDLSRGLAKQLSGSLVGQQIDGIWHTSIVVYGSEYAFGQGILKSKPGQSIYGDPVDIIDYGETQIPKDVFEDYIQGMQQVWTSDKYHLLSNNCNHFSNEVIQFLVGQNIPSHISDLPNDFAKTSLGQQLLPMIEGMYGTPPAGNLGQSLPTAAAASTSTHTSTPSTVPTFSSGYTDNQNKGSKYLKSIQVSSVKELQDGILKNNPAVVIYFTSATCPPCRVIAPHFETMLNEVNSDSLRAQRNEYIVGVKVDCSVQFQIGSHYNVSATPTFMFFKNGEKTSQFSGANYQELKSEIDLLMFVAYPKHPHINLSLPTMMSLASRPITFSGNPATKVEAIGKKLAQFLSDSELSGQPLKQLIDSLSILLKSPSTSIAKANINSATVPTLAKMYDALSWEKIFPLLDIIRLLLPYIGNNIFSTKDGKKLLSTIITDGEKNISVLPAPSLLMLLRLSCNLFEFDKMVLLAVDLRKGTSNPEVALSKSSREVVTSLLINSLLHEKDNIRQMASSLAFNFSMWSLITTVGNKSPNSLGEFEYYEKWRKSISDTESDLRNNSVENEEWVSEVVSAVLNALEVEGNSSASKDGESDAKAKSASHQVIVRLLASLANFLYMAPDEVFGIAEALNMDEILKEKEKIKAPGTEADNIKPLVKEIRDLVRFHSSSSD